VGDDPPHQGIAIGVQARGREAQHDVALADALGREDVGVLDDLVAAQRGRIRPARAGRGAPGSPSTSATRALSRPVRSRLRCVIRSGRPARRCSHEERFGAADDDVIDDHADG
jgi:hypothetical protein